MLAHLAVDVRGAIEADRCTVFARRPGDAGMFGALASSDSGALPVGPMNFAAAGTWHERCLADGQTLWLEEISDRRDGELLHAQNARAAVLVPFRARGEPEAVLSCYFAAARRFTELELVSLRYVATLTAFALERLRFEEVEAQRRRRSEGLERTMVALHDARELHDVLAIAARGLSHDFGRPCASYHLTDGIFRPVAASDVAKIRLPIPLDTIDLEGLRVRPVLRRGDDDLLAVSSDGQLRALFVLESSRELLSEDDTKYLLSIGAYVALALTSAMAFDQLRRYAAEGAALTGAARTILGFTELEPLAEALCRLGLRLAFAECACVYARRDDELVPVGFAAIDEHQRVPERLPPDETEARALLAKTFGRSPYIATRLPLPGGAGGSERHGLLLVTRPHGYAFERAETRLIESLVTLAALAIRNVDLYEQSVEANQALGESNAFKDDLMAMFAHDFKGPLQVISGYSELLLETEREEVQQYLRTIVEQTKRLTKLSEDALALAATQSAGFSLSRQEQDVTAFLQETAGPLDHGSGRLTFVAPGQPVTLAFDRGRLRHVVENVVGNALKYSTGKVEVRVVPLATGVRIEVADEGIGIPADERERVFARFGRGTNARTRGISGSGVGLYIAKKIVEVHGGRLTVESVENVGSTFSIALPRGHEVP
ncbi:MAG: ATP-binding protein [Vulcanimicrobiaceae bacterium]